jgi:hypothetical protein
LLLNSATATTSTNKTPHSIMATPTTSQHVSLLLLLPRELRDEIIGYLALPDCVYTSCGKPERTYAPGSRTKQGDTFVDTRIYLPYCIPPNVLGVCRQLREECLQYNYNPPSSLHASTTDPGSYDKPISYIMTRDLENVDHVAEEAERLGDCHLRITIEADRMQRGSLGYSTPIREELSDRFLTLLPLMQRSRKLRIVVWAGVSWWNGARPRGLVKVNGRMKIDDTAPAKPDTVSSAISKILEQLPAVEELEVDVLAHVHELAKWDVPDLVWTNIQYWLDGPIVPNAEQTLRKVNRRLAGVWNSKLVEALYVQQETRVEGSDTWHIKRHGDMRLVSNLVLRWKSY